MDPIGNGKPEEEQGGESWLREASELPDNTYETLFSKSNRKQRFAEARELVPNLSRMREIQYGTTLDGMTLAEYRSFVRETLQGAARDSALRRFPPIGIIRHALLKALEVKKKTPAANQGNRLQA